MIRPRKHHILKLSHIAPAIKEIRGSNALAHLELRENEDNQTSKHIILYLNDEAKLALVTNNNQIVESPMHHSTSETQNICQQSK